MSEIVIKLAKPRGALERGTVDFDERDIHEWGVYAIRHGAWRCHCDVGETRFGANVEAVVVIAAPDGRVAVWYGRTTLPRVLSNRQRHGRKDDTASQFDGAIAALSAHGNLGRAAAAYWDKRRTRGGDRDVTQLAMAACRILHAEVFGDPTALRDTLLAEFAAMTTSRPPTPHLLRASEDELLAASALLAAGNHDGACRLLARKGVAA